MTKGIKGEEQMCSSCQLPRSHQRALGVLYLKRKAVPEAVPVEAFLALAQHPSRAWL